MSAEDESRFSKCRLKVFDVDDDDKDSDAFKRRVKKSPNLVNKTILNELILFLTSCGPDLKIETANCSNC
jgi:hypothetical protein